MSTHKSECAIAQMLKRLTETVLPPQLANFGPFDAEYVETLLWAGLAKAGCVDVKARALQVPLECIQCRFDV